MTRRAKVAGLWAAGVVAYVALVGALTVLFDPDDVMLGIIILTLPAVNLYPLFYLFRPWRSLPQGRALMLKACGNVIVLDMVAAFAFLGDYPFREQIRVAGFGLFALGINYLFWTLITSPGAQHYPPRSWFRRRRQERAG